MSKPMRRTWEGVLVLLFASNSQAGMSPVAPARDEFVAELDHPSTEVAVDQPIVAAPATAMPTIDTLTAEAFSERFEPFPEMILPRTITLRAASASEQPALQPTAVPLPPALWPGAITLAGVALAMVIRQHRRA